MLYTQQKYYIEVLKYHTNILPMAETVRQKEFKVAKYSGLFYLSH